MSLTAMWTKRTGTDQLKRSSACASAVGSTVYVFGGELEPRKPRDNDVYKLHLNSASGNVDVQTVTAKAASPSPRVGAATTSLNGRVYMFSGRGGEAMAPIEEKGHVWVLNPSTETWTYLPPSTTAYPEARSYHSMTNNGTDTLYVHAGCPEGCRLSDLWGFNVQTSEWKQLASAPDPPRGGPSIAFAHGKIYRMNGFDGKTE